MQMKIIVETEEEFNKWLAEQKTFKETVMVDESEAQAFNSEDGNDVAMEETSSEE